MNLNEYQQLALRTAKRDREPALETCINAMGLAGEAGEFCDYVKKHVGQGHPMDKVVLCKELGDILWYVAVNAERAGLTLEQVAGMNIDKLCKRYPDGFSDDASLNRVEANA